MSALLLGAPGIAHAADCRARLTPRPVVGAPGTRPITATDLIELRDFGIPDGTPSRSEIFSLSPDGRFAAVQLRRADVATNSYCTGVAAVDLATGRARLLDVGGEPILMRADMHGQADRIIGALHAPPPAWSPDGHSLIFLRRDHNVTQLWRVAIAGGSARHLTSGNEDIRGFVWAPDGRSIRIAVRPGVAADRAQIAREGRSGYLYDRRFWPMSDAAPIPSSASQIVWRRIDAETGRPLATQETEPPPGPAPGLTLEAVSPTGARAWTAPADSRVFLGPEPLTIERQGHLDRCSAPSCAERVVGLWWEPGGSLLFLRDWGNARAGRIELFRWRPGSNPVSLFATKDDLLDCHYARATLFCARETATRPRHLVAIDPDDGHMRIVYDPNPEFAAVRLGGVERLQVRAADGAFAFADLVLPPDHVAGETHPMVVVQYQSRGFLRGGTGDDYPIFLLAARGYAVLSYNRPIPYASGMIAPTMDAFQRLNVTGWADRRQVFTALEAAVDAAIARGAVDPTRLGITGLSEGAASTIWAILNTHRYRAAAISSCCEDPSTTRYALGPEYLHETVSWGYPGPGEDDPAFWAPYSLALGAKRVTTPLLLQMSDHEFRFALEAVANLEHAGKAVELYVYPHEYHIKWQPAHRLAVYTRALDWFDFWLRDRIDPDPAKAAQYARWRALQQRAETSP